MLFVLAIGLALLVWNIDLGIVSEPGDDDQWASGDDWTYEEDD